jgi:hypothetical protein
MGHVLNYLLTDETKRTHRGTWWVWAGGEKLRHTATMRGTWGWDVTCSCGNYESRTGGATRHSVEESFFDHRYSAQSEAATAAEMRAAGLDPADQGQLIDYLHAAAAGLPYRARTAEERFRDALG